MEMTQKSVEDVCSIRAASGQRGKVSTLSNDSAITLKMLTAQTQLGENTS